MRLVNFYEKLSLYEKFCSLEEFILKFQDPFGYLV